MADRSAPHDGPPAVTRFGSIAPINPSIPSTQWEAIERDSDFRELVQEKRKFIIPATIFFFVYYFAFLILVGYFPDLVDVKVIGNINLAYLFALSEFIMAWVLMYLYIRRARLFDTLASRILAKVKGGQR